MIGKDCVPHFVDVEMVRGSDSETGVEIKCASRDILTSARPKGLLLGLSPARLPSMEHASVCSQARWRVSCGQSRKGPGKVGLEVKAALEPWGQEVTVTS